MASKIMGYSLWDCIFFLKLNNTEKQTEAIKDIHGPINNWNLTY